ncbi:MAG: YlxR family protein [Dehalococcoidia bacterium]|nr:YlxR family protein [Dehalococcoidia bacterium]
MKMISPGDDPTEKRAPRVRHVPERSCVACGAKRAKADLVRVVCSPAKTVEIDLQGKKLGRGAYFCKSAACWESGLKKGRLEHVLKDRLNPEERESLSKYGKSLAEADSGKLKQD